jgi:hypothetical protein
LLSSSAAVAGIYLHAPRSQHLYTLKRDDQPMRTDLLPAIPDLSPLWVNPMMPEAFVLPGDLALTVRAHKRMVRQWVGQARRANREGQPAIAAYRLNRAMVARRLAIAAQDALRRMVGRLQVAPTGEPGVPRYCRRRSR